ncbi:MAG: hypothetical protein D6732_06870 [Methanobacteriota archaeon]|nr:MAG: hypothetical protein D6732_06870 [Euryarchaeota archaeon]
MDAEEWTPWLDDMENLLETGKSIVSAFQKKLTKKKLTDTKNMLHSMKGLFDMIGMSDSAKAIAELEERVHNEGINLTDTTKNGISDLIEKLENFLQFIRENRPEETSDLEGVLGLESIFIRTSKIYSIEIEFGAERGLKSARAMGVLNSLKRMAKIRNSIPSEEDLIMDVNFETLKVEVSTFETIDDLYTKLQKLPDVISVTIEEKITSKSTKRTTSQTIKIATDDLSTLEKSITLLNSQIESLKNDVEEVEALYKLASIERSFANIEKDLQKLRKVSLNTILNQIPAMAQRLAKAEGKEVNVTVQGRYVTINRILANSIIDPITQIVRNAIVHGIEYPSDRLEKGKDAVGTISIIGKAERGRVIIEISDDGKGLDEKAILEVAKARKLKIPKKARKSEIYNLIFEEGFSTQKGTKKVAGRGLGLSAAKEKIEGFGGTIRVTSEPGKGTTFVMELPDPDLLTKNLIVKVRGLYYAIPSSEVEFALIALPQDLELKDQISGTIHYEEEKVPVVLLRNLIKGENEPFITDLKEKEIVLVCRGREKKVGLIVDQIVDERLLNVQPLSPLLQKFEIFEGVISGVEQDLMLVVNPAAIA